VERTFEQKQLFLDIADAIEAQPELYNQGQWFDYDMDCRTTCCIAGWALRLADTATFWELVEDGPAERNFDYIQEKAIELLGLSESEASKLFWMNARPIDENMTMADALRKIAGGDPIEHLVKG